MNKHFLLLFSLFCLIVAAASLKCLTCHLHMTADRCRRGFGICTAQKDETCMNLKIIYNSSQVLSYMDCQKFCKTMKHTVNKRIYQYNCCNSNYCNREI
ncbi:PREDICTED: prostate and testis expressed protein 3 [Chinchilla lanigera]|uniref:Prostate and testis expressed 3 n=1 Tax=Chinchilla lanigera TaxID=34839 RepID=A0A8C2W390_CHILA|nr:PREDICTED: prostate and testis expressed protein 3 [Chinchilla lanigera]